MTQYRRKYSNVSRQSAPQHHRQADRVMTEYPGESYDELVRLASLRPPGPGADQLARNLR
jgi:hypothetical protein